MWTRPCSFTTLYDVILIVGASRELWRHYVGHACLQAVGSAPDDTFAQQMLRRALASLVDVDLDALLADDGLVRV